MKAHRWRRLETLYFTVIVLTGWTLVGYSALLEWYPGGSNHWLFLALPLVLFRRNVIQLPNCEGRLDPSGIFLLYAALLCSPTQAALIAALEVALKVRKQTTMEIPKLMFNLAVVPISIYGAAIAGQKVQSLLGNTGGGLMLSVVAATVLFFALNVSLVMGMMRLNSGPDAPKVSRAVLLWSVAHYLASGTTAGLLALWNAGIPLSTAVATAMVLVCHASLNHYFGVLLQRETALEEKQAALEDLRATHIASLETLALAIEAKDPATYGHTRRVQRLAVVLGKAHGLSSEAMDTLEVASLLHDIGKLALPEHLLYRTEELNEEDQQKLRRHAQVGADILRNSRLGPRVLSVIRHHHERWDGSGYPGGLAGDHCPLEARVLTVADCYDKLRFPRSDRGLSPREALTAIQQQSGTTFDPRVIDTLRNVPDLFQIAECGWNLSFGPGLGPLPFNANVMEDFKSAHKEGKAIYSLIQNIRATPELESNLKLVADAIHDALPFEALTVYLPGSDGRSLDLAYSEGTETIRLEDEEVLRAAGCVDTPEPNGWVEEALAKARTALQPKLAVATQTPHLFCESFLVPLGNETVGGLLVWRSAHSRSNEGRRLVEALLDHAGPAIAHASFYERFRRESRTDPLTGLANKRAMRQRGAELLESSQQQEPSGCVVMLDLNGFKAINDTLGHHQGDCLLVQVSRLLTRHVREMDLVARNGGDEFVMILPHLTRAIAVERLARISEEIRDLWPPGWEAGATGASFGIAAYPEDGSSLEALLQVADTRMYEDKRARHQQALNQEGVQEAA